MPESLNILFLAAEAERGLREQGVETETVFLNDLKIRGCQACYWCKKNDVSECAVKDDMQIIHQLMKECDGIIVASPIYFAGVTAQTKAWLPPTNARTWAVLNTSFPAGPINRDINWPVAPAPPGDRRRR